MSFAGAIAAFEAGSGLRISQLGTIFAWFGGVCVCLLITWTIVQYTKGLFEQRIDLRGAIFGAMAATFVMVASLAFFAAGSPLASN